jgi:trigger factor
MEFKVEDISNIKKKITFEIDAQRVEKTIESTYKKIGKTAKLKGFRAGKVPRPVLEKFYSGKMTEDAVREMFNVNYAKALMREEFTAVSEPTIVDSCPLEKGKPFTFTVEVEVKPEIEAKDYTGLSLKRENLVVNDQVIDERLKEISKDKGTLEESERSVAEKGDFVTIDFEGSMNNKPIEHGEAKDYTLELGSQSLISGFEEQITGMEKGTEKDIEVTFPEDYASKELAGKKAVFKVSLKSIQEKVMPELNDEFAQQFGVDTFAEFRKKITDSYEDYEKKRILDDLKERIVTALLEKNHFDVPETLVQAQLKSLFDNLLERLKKQGLSLEQTGMTDETFQEKNREKAERQVKAALILEAIAIQEKLSPTPEDLDKKLELMAQDANVSLETVKEFYESSDNRKNLNSILLEEKVVEYLLDNADIQDVDKSELEKSEKLKVDDQ